MNVKPHPWEENVMILVKEATILEACTLESTPLSYTRKRDQEEMNYHLLDISIENNAGVAVKGTALLPRKVLEIKPNGYTLNNKIEVSLNLNGSNAGKTSVYLPDSRFDISQFIDSETAKKFNISLADVTGTSEKEVATDLETETT